MKGESCSGQNQKITSKNWIVMSRKVVRMKTPHFSKTAGAILMKLGHITDMMFMNILMYTTVNGGWEPGDSVPFTGHRSDSRVLCPVQDTFVSLLPCTRLRMVQPSTIPKFEDLVHSQ